MSFLDISPLEWDRKLYVTTKKISWMKWAGGLYQKMPNRLDPRWASKESLLALIRGWVVTAGGKIDRLGKSDCFEIQIEGQGQILLALKETGKDQAHHKEAQTSWIGVPERFLNRVLELDQTIRPHVMFLVIDHWDQHLVIIPSNAALVTMVRRERKGASLHLSFNVKKTLHGYSVQTSWGEPDIAIAVEHIDTLEPLEALLRVP